MRGLGVRPTAYNAISEEAHGRLARLCEWSLTEVARRAQRERGWTDAKRASVERAYRRFLALIAIEPTKSFGMASCDVDAMWHQHILDTRNYLAMCDAVFGMVVHHCPKQEGATAPEDHYATATLPALRSFFGVRAGLIWPLAGPASAFSKCCNHVGDAPDRLAA